MKEINKKIRELLRDAFKDYLKLTLLALFTAGGLYIASLIKSISSIYYNVNLSVIFSVLASFIIILYLLIIIKSKYNKIKKELEEYKDPQNKNVEDFSLGDIVVQKIKKDLRPLPSLSVCRITRSDIVCRDSEGDIIKCSPEELLTDEETNIIINKINLKQKRDEQETKEYNESLNFY